MIWYVHPKSRKCGAYDETVNFSPVKNLKKPIPEWRARVDYVMNQTLYQCQIIIIDLAKTILLISKMEIYQVCLGLFGANLKSQTKKQCCFFGL